MELWEEHKSWVLIPALPLVSWANITSYSTSLCLDSFACGRERTHMASPSTCARWEQESPFTFLLRPCGPRMLLSDLLPPPLPLLSLGSSPGRIPRALAEAPPSTSAWVGPLVSLLGPACLLSDPLSCSRTEAGTQPTSYTFALPPRPVLPDCAVSSSSGRSVSEPEMGLVPDVLSKPRRWQGWSLWKSPVQRPSLTSRPAQRRNQEHLKPLGQ